MSNATDREARYARLADAVEAGDYEVVDRSVEVRPDYRPGRRLAEYAERTGQPMSAVIRAAIDEYLDSHPAA